jgi:hypothetical protein
MLQWGQVDWYKHESMEVRNVLDDSHEAFDSYSFICTRICVFHEAVAANFTSAGMSVTNSVKVGTGFELQSGKSSLYRPVALCFDSHNASPKREVLTT